MNYWLIKSDGGCYSIDDLKRDKKTSWTGVRNYQARNFMKEMKKGEQILFYHSSSTKKGVYGIATVVGESHPNETQFQKNNEYYEPRATREKPVWYCVDIAFTEKFIEPVTLNLIAFDPALEGMMLRQRGSRLSIQPVSEKHFLFIKKMSKK